MKGGSGEGGRRSDGDGREALQRRRVCSPCKRSAPGFTFPLASILSALGCELRPYLGSKRSLAERTASYVDDRLSLVVNEDRDFEDA